MFVLCGVAPLYSWKERKDVHGRNGIIGTGVSEQRSPFLEGDARSDSWPDSCSSELGYGNFWHLVPAAKAVGPDLSGSTRLQLFSAQKLSLGTRLRSALQLSFGTRLRVQGAMAVLRS